MDGRSLKAGAVAGVTKVKNSILLARSVMEKSEHVMLTGTVKKYLQDFKTSN